MNGNDVKRWEEAKEMAKKLEISVKGGRMFFRCL